MAVEDLDTLGFNPAVPPPLHPPHPQPARGPAGDHADGGGGEGERVAGLDAAKRAKGGLFGFTLPGSGDTPSGSGRRGGGH
jgi:hypothetical protein